MRIPSRHTTFASVRLLPDYRIRTGLDNVLLLTPRPELGGREQTKSSEGARRLPLADLGLI